MEGLRTFKRWTERLDSATPHAGQSGTQSAQCNTRLATDSAIVSLEGREASGTDDDASREEPSAEEIRY